MTNDPTTGSHSSGNESAPSGGGASGQPNSPMNGPDTQPYDGGAYGQANSHDSRPFDADQPYQQPYQQPYEPSQTQPYQQGYGQSYGQSYGQGYGQGQGYQPGQAQPYGQLRRSPAGESAAQLSLILGIVGLFFAGIVLGPMAIWQAGKAEKLGVQATAGKVLGWISTILWALGVLSGVAFFVIILAGLGAAGSYSG